VSSEARDGLRPELLDDFYAECDELLETARAALTQLESALKSGGSAGSSLEALFRAMHSIKGICAIAGVRPAEELAHGIEDLLRVLTRGEIAVTPAMADAILQAAGQLAKIVGAHRQQKRLPSGAEALRTLKTHLPGRTELPIPPPPAPVSTEPDPVAGARGRGLGIWRVVFSPSPELEKRNVRVNVVRERLAQVGEILSAAPSVQPGGLRFVFVFGARQEPADLAAWEKDGVTFEPVGVPPAAAEAGAAAATPAADADDAAESALSLTPSHIVRVDLGQLDDLMRITGEIIIHRSRLKDRIGSGRMAGDELKDIDLALGRSLRELRAAVSRVRLVPVAEIFSRMPYVVRDLQRDSRQQVRVVLEGEQTEIDKYLVERLKEPLLHLVRNALAHGIETPDQRRAAGKEPEATLRLRAGRSGGMVDIEVADDGRGVDPAAIATRARAMGLRVPETLDADALLGLLCAPGFSTRETADRGAGRGVGMAVVRNTIHDLGGTLRLASAPGKGTAFTLRLPLTLSIADVLVLRVAAQLCAIPQGHVEEIFQVEVAQLRTIQQTEIVPYRGALLPILRLRTIFGIAERSGGEEMTVVVVRTDRGATGLVVDRVDSRREIVLRPLSDPLVRVPGMAGATELGDGKPILVLDPAALTAGVVRPTGPVSATVSDLVSA
jgi:two-component system chemotaxis sensor kinase CheA